MSSRVKGITPKDGECFTWQSGRSKGHNSKGWRVFYLAEWENGKVKVKALGWGWGVAPCGWKVMLAEAGRGPLRDCAGSLLAQTEEVQAPSPFCHCALPLDLSHKAEVAGPSQSCCQGWAWLREEAPSPPTILSPSAGSSSQGLATPSTQHPHPSAGLRGGRLSRGPCRVGGFPRAGRKAGWDWHFLRWRHCRLDGQPARASLRLRAPAGSVLSLWAAAPHPRGVSCPRGRPKGHRQCREWDRARLRPNLGCCQALREGAT